MNMEKWGSHRRAAAGMALAAMACLALWRWSAEAGQSPFERARLKAEQAVEMELGGAAGYASLREAMTAEAARRALADRAASGLDEALARSGARIKARATPVAVERTAGGWSVRGVARAQWEGGAAGAGGPWSGEWAAALVEGEGGELRVSKLTMASQAGGPGR